MAKPVCYSACMFLYWSGLRELFHLVIVIDTKSQYVNGRPGPSRGTRVHLTFGSRAPRTMSHLGSLAPITLILSFYKRFNRQSPDSVVFNGAKMHLLQNGNSVIYIERRCITNKWIPWRARYSKNTIKLPLIFDEARCLIYSLRPQFFR